LPVGGGGRFAGTSRGRCSTGLSIAIVLAVSFQ
jgi:hypothetical protein